MCYSKGERENKSYDKGTDANVYDVTPVPELLTSEQTVVYGGKEYLDAEKREDAIVCNRQRKRIQYKIDLRQPQSKRASWGHTVLLVVFHWQAGSFLLLYSVASYLYNYIFD